MMQFITTVDHTHSFYHIHIHKLT